MFRLAPGQRLRQAKLRGRSMNGAGIIPFPAMTGHVAAWLDTSPKYTDTARTTEATATNDSVASWYDSISGYALEQATAGRRMKLLKGSDHVNGKDCVVTQEIAANNPYGFTWPAGLNIDRRSATMWAVLRWCNNGSSSDGLFNPGAGLTDCLTDTSGYDTASTQPPALRMFGTGPSNGDTVSYLHGDVCVAVVSMGASNATSYIDDASHTSASAFAAGTVTGGAIFHRLDPNFPTKARVYACGLLNQQITAGDLTALKTWAYARFRRAAPTKQFVAVGDSMTQGQHSTLGKNWPTYCADTYLPVGWRPTNYGRSAYSANLVAASFAAAVTPRYSGSFTKNVLCVWLGTNDLGNEGRTSAQLITSIDTILTSWRGAGGKTVVATVIKRGDAAWTGTMETYRGEYNTAIRTGGSLAAKVDALVDLDLDGAFDDYNDTTYYEADKLHITQTGQNRVAELFATGIQAV